VPGRSGAGAEQHDLEAGPPPQEAASATDKQMDVFFEAVSTIKVGAAR